jgi:hypothetical protein
MESLQSSKLALNVSGNVNPNWGCNNPRAGAGTFGTCAPIKRGELVRMESGSKNKGVQKRAKPQ